jgi:P4 family phage/plasmid primase-like protien
MKSSLNNLISLFPSALETEPDSILPVREFIESVQDGRWQKEITLIRRHLAAGDRKRYDDRKRALPGVTLSAACVSRAHDLDIAAKAIQPSGWLQADFDGKDNGHLEDPEVCSGIRQALLNDPHVGGVFVGPSGQGIKALVSIDAERHRDSWFAADAYFLETHGLKLDKSTKDPLRLCFVSHDPLAAVSEDFTPLPVPEVRPSQNTSFMPPVETTAADINEMLAVIPPRPDYETWLRIASAVWSVLPLADGCHVLNAWSREEREGEYALKHKHRLAQVGIGTLVHIASQHGFDAKAAWKRQRWCGRIRFAEGTRSPADSEDPTADPAPTGLATEGELDRATAIDAMENGQIGDARLWKSLRKGLRVWNIHADLWMIYEDGVWRRDEGRTTITDLSDTLCRVYGNLTASVRQEMAADPAPDKKKDPRMQEIANIGKRYHALRSRNYLRNVEQLAATELQLPATAFDAHPHLLALENKVLDFDEGLVREHRPIDFLTHRTSIIFNEKAECPAWDAFLDFFMQGDQDLIAYLSRAVGFSLTGFVDQDILFFCYGKGANGKSTFMGALKMLLGDLMTTVPMNALLSDKSDSNYDYQKASMEGRRIVVTDEIPEGKRMAEERIKQIIGGDDIAARRPFEKPYNFKPTHKLWLVGNHKPEIRGTDHGIWRRISLIPWTVTMPEDKRRPRHEVLAEFRAELPGILNWAIRGYLEMQAIGGLKPPAGVRAATAEYQSESDQFGQFMAECMVVDRAGETTLKALLNTYQFWCDQNGETCRYRTTKKLADYLREHDHPIERVGKENNHAVIGLRLIEDDPEPQNVMTFGK